MTQNAIKLTPSAPPLCSPTAPVADTKADPQDSRISKLTPDERSPAYWTIVRFGDKIHATNTVTRRVFSGSIVEFNKLFK